LITASSVNSASGWSTDEGFRGLEEEPGIEYSRGAARPAARILQCLLHGYVERLKQQE
jgi:hypothetical protein